MVCWLRVTEIDSRGIYQYAFAIGVSTDSARGQQLFSAELQLAGSRRTPELMEQ
jgi:hypothetical protein